MLSRLICWRSRGLTRYRSIAPPCLGIPAKLVTAQLMRKTFGRPSRFSSAAHSGRCVGLASASYLIGKGSGSPSFARRWVCSRRRRLESHSLQAHVLPAASFVAAPALRPPCARLEGGVARGRPADRSRLVHPAALGVGSLSRSSAFCARRRGPAHRTVRGVLARRVCPSLVRAGFPVGSPRLL